MTTNNKQREKPIRRQNVTLTLRASDLDNYAGPLRGFTDSFAVVTLLDEDANSTPKVLGKTEVIKNSLNPLWTKSFLLEYELSKPMYINVGIYHEIRKTQKHKPMGSAVFEIGEILGSRGNVKAKKIKTGGSLIARVETAPAQSSGDLTITLRGAQLKNAELMGRIDPFFEVSRMDGPDGSAWLPVLRSKHIENNLSPMWEAVTIDLDRLCDGDEERPIKISVFDYGRRGNHRPMGSFETSLNDLIAANISGNNAGESGERSFALVEKGVETGRIFVADASVRRDDTNVVASVASKDNESEESSPIENEVRDDKYLNICLQGRQLRNMEFLGKSDPFFEISRRMKGPGGSVKLKVFRSEHITNDRDPKWELAAIDLNRLCDGDKDKPITVSVFDYEQSGNHKKMGSFDTTVNKLLERASDKPDDISKSFVLVRKGEKMGRIVVTDALIKVGTGRSADDHIEREEIVPSKSKSASAKSQVQGINETKSAGSVKVSDGVGTERTPPTKTVENLPRPSFLDYISGGCELQMCIAIDFGESNGDPQVPGTLHYVHDDGELNDYEKAISTVGSILAKYDSDQKFPVWGFGARFCGKVQNCFQVGSDAEAQGIGGVLESYREMSQSSLCMSSPSLITEVIEKAASDSIMAQGAASSVDNQCYTILLILTSGAVDYMDATKDAIAAASIAPLSIVIVGIGDTNFEGMQDLDDFALEQKGSVRDITQFVEFRAHKDDKTSLTRATLEEIPDQLVDYFYSRGIMPNPILSENELQIVPDDYNKETDINLCLKFDTDGKIAVETDKSEANKKFQGMVNKIRTMRNVSSKFQTGAPLQSSLPGNSEQNPKSTSRRHSVTNLFGGRSRAHQPPHQCESENSPQFSGVRSNHRGSLTNVEDRVSYFGTSDTVE